MNIEILEQGLFSSALVRLNPGDDFVSESGAMYRASSNIDIDVTTRSRGKGGLLAGLKRLLAAENFFFSTYQVTDNQPGEVGLAPTHAGEIRLIPLDGSVAWYCTGGSYLGSSSSLAIDTEFQGVKGLLSGESLSFVKVSGVGQLLVSAFGRLVELPVQDALTVDTGHVVAYEETLQYTLGKAGNSWLQSILAGEGIVFHFTGRGKVLVQSHNPGEFGRTLGPLLPPKG